ncbi:hypothetical protein F2Q69_00022538 [Brassica cretica]|uniref:Uncharacterized protein n=1 Tax=Brassica cretica TaxID=69181 RepID=A0A8S9Q6F8_BRACR|nr:hypothetical protein F2Q69_00022538 [Brassica cretica]
MSVRIPLFSCSTRFRDDLLGTKPVTVEDAHDQALSVCQRVNQEACRVVETMWMQDAEPALDKLEEQFYTMEKRQEYAFQVHFKKRKV